MYFSVASQNISTYNHLMGILTVYVYIQLNNSLAECLLTYMVYKLMFIEPELKCDIMISS